MPNILSHSVLVCVCVCVCVCRTGILPEKVVQCSAVGQGVRADVEERRMLRLCPCPRRETFACDFWWVMCLLDVAGKLSFGKVASRGGGTHVALGRGEDAVK